MHAKSVLKLQRKKYTVKKERRKVNKCETHCGGSVTPDRSQRSARPDPDRTQRSNALIQREPNAQPALIQREPNAQPALIQTEPNAQPALIECVQT